MSFNQKSHQSRGPFITSPLSERCAEIVSNTYWIAFKIETNSENNFFQVLLNCAFKGLSIFFAIFDRGLAKKWQFFLELKMNILTPARLCLRLKF